jgi:hypothetical protein
MTKAYRSDLGCPTDQPLATMLGSTTFVGMGQATPVVAWQS